MIEDKELTYEEQLRRPEWVIKKNKILERDNHTCQICKNRINLLEVHHIRYDRRLKAWEYPDSILITLCYECHKKVHGRKDDCGRSLKMQHISEVFGLIFSQLRDNK
jgi:5-methylcytosine-specific restriction endonuclease McrA